MNRFFRNILMLILILPLIGVFFSVPLSNVNAADAPVAGKTAQVTKPPFDIREMKLNLSLGDFSKFSKPSYAPCTKQDKEKVAEDGAKMCWYIPWIPEYIGALYKYGVTFGSIVAVIALMIGGVMYMISGMNTTYLGKAKEMIRGAIFGLLLLLGSYMMLNAINPQLIEMPAVEIEVIKTAKLLQNSFCSEVTKEGFIVDTAKAGNLGTASANWNTGSKATCGEEFAVKLTEAGRGGGQFTAGSGQTCVSDYCGTTPGKCVADLEKGGFSCKDVFMYGAVMIPNSVNFALCGNIEKAVVGGAGILSDMYVDNIKLVYRFSRDTDSWSDLSKEITIGEGVKSYTITSRDLVKTPGEMSSWPKDTQIAMVLEINDPGWGSFGFVPSIDENFIVSGFKDGESDTSVSAMLVCRVGSENTVYKKIGQVPNLVTNFLETGRIWKKVEKPAWLTSKEFQTSTPGIHWDINVAENFFACENIDGGFREPGCAELSILDKCGGTPGAGASCAGTKEVCMPPAALALAYPFLIIPIVAASEADVDICMNVTEADPSMCQNGLKCNTSSLTCSCGVEGVECNGNADCSDGFVCSRVEVLGDSAIRKFQQKCTPLAVGANEGANCVPGPGSINRAEGTGAVLPAQVCNYVPNGAGLVCDDATAKCVTGPLKCSDDNTCRSSALYSNSATCFMENKYCTCNSDNDCESGHVCRKGNNVMSLLYPGAAANFCTPSLKQKLGESCQPTPDNCADNLFCDSDIKVCVSAPPACDPAQEGKPNAAGLIVNQCKGITGWENGSCDGNWCDCDSFPTSQCSEGYRCADNDGSKFNANDACVADE